MSLSLTTKEKVKAYLGITTTTNDSFIDSLIEDISSQVEAYCNRKFESATRVEYFDTEDGDKKIFLNNYPVTNLADVEYRTGTWGNITWLDFNENDYLLDDESGILKFAGRFNDADKFVKVTYTGGYLISFNNETDVTLHTLPRDLTFMVTEMVAQTYQNRKSQGISSETTEGQSITYTSGSRDLTENSDYSKRLLRYRNFNF